MMIKFRRLRWASHIAVHRSPCIHLTAEENPRLFPDLAFMLRRMKPRTLHRSPCIHLTADENVGLFTKEFFTMYLFIFTINVI